MKLKPQEGKRAGFVRFAFYRVDMLQSFFYRRLFEMDTLYPDVRILYKLSKQ